MILMAGILFGIFIYHCFRDNNKPILPIYSTSNNDEIMKVIKTMKKDLIINKDKYSFIEINDIINIIIDIYIKNKCKYSEDDDITLFIENHVPFEIKNEFLLLWEILKSEVNKYITAPEKRILDAFKYL